MSQIRSSASHPSGGPRVNLEGLPSDLGAPEANRSARNHSRGIRLGIGMGLLTLWLLTTLTWWGVAFFPVTQDSPEWLLRVQAVCFGTKHDGLPEGFGWILLFVAPASFLLSVLVVYWSEIRGDVGRLLTQRAGRLLLCFLLCFFAVELAWVGTRLRAGLNQRAIEFTPANIGSLPPQYPLLDRPLPEFKLTNQRGESVSLQSFQGKKVLLSFVYAHCQTVCPALVTTTTRALAALNDPSVVALLVTLDPWRDTPASLPSMAKRWALPEQAHLVSGSVPEVTHFLDQLQVPWKRNEKTGDVDHPALFYLVDAQAHIRFAFNNPSVSWIQDATARISN